METFIKREIYMNGTSRRKKLLNILMYVVKSNIIKLNENRCWRVHKQNPLVQNQSDFNINSKRSTCLCRFFFFNLVLWNVLLKGFHSDKKIIKNALCAYVLYVEREHLSSYIFIINNSCTPGLT